MFQIQEILLAVEIIKQTHAQNVLKEMEQVGVMATVCGRVVAVQQLQKILLAVGVIKQTHAQNVPKVMEQVGVMATVCGRVVAVQQQVNFFHWKMFTYYHFQSRNTKHFMQRNQKIIIFGNRNCRMAPVFKKTKGSNKTNFSKKSRNRRRRIKMYENKNIVLLLQLKWTTTKCRTWR